MTARVKVGDLLVLKEKYSHEHWYSRFFVAFVTGTHYSARVADGTLRQPREINDIDVLLGDGTIDWVSSDFYKKVTTKKRKKTAKP